MKADEKFGVTGVHFATPNNDALLYMTTHENGAAKISHSQVFEAGTMSLI